MKRHLEGNPDMTAKQAYNLEINQLNVAAAATAPTYCRQLNDRYSDIKFSIDLLCQPRVRIWIYRLRANLLLTVVNCF